MVTAGIHLAAGAIAAALLLAGTGGAVAAAEPTGESAGAGGEKASSAASEATAPSTHSTGTGAVPGTGHPTTTVGNQADNAGQHPATGRAGSTPGKSKDEPAEEKPAAATDHGSDECPGKTVNKTPPEAPPPMDQAPVPDAPLAPVLEVPPPADLPPALPASPVDPSVVDSVAGEDGHHPGNAPPVLTVPVLVAPEPIPSVHLGASIAPRWTTGGRIEAQSGGEAAPQLLRASTNERLLNESSLTSVTSSGQLASRTGFSEYSSRPLATMAAGALPGLAGLVLVTAAGICLGYRQANMAQRRRTDGAARFLA